MAYPTSIYDKEGDVLEVEEDGSIGVKITDSDVLLRRNKGNS